MSRFDGIDRGVRRRGRVRSGDVSEMSGVSLAEYARACDLMARGVEAQGARWALNTDAICARKLLDAMDRQKGEADGQG